MTKHEDQIRFMQAQIEDQAAEIKRLKSLLAGPKLVVPFSLPRRQAQILGIIMTHAPNWVAQDRIVSAVFGDEDIDVRNVLHSHVSKMRRRFRPLGADILSSRFLGYRMTLESVAVLTSGVLA